MHAGMLVLHAGMRVLLSNADNHVARHKRLLVPDHGVLISYTKAFLQCSRKCLCQDRGCLPQAKQLFHQSKASSCHTAGSACGRQRSACSKHGHLFDSLGPLYSRTREPGTRECLCDMQECLLHTKITSY
jgi:hypothetical protein